MRKIIVKEGPLVFLRNVLIMEIIASVFIYIISLLQNYEMIYRSLGLLKFLRYDIFLILAFSIFQLIYVSLLFLDWYFSHFEITEKEIVRKYGLLFRHRKFILLSDVISVETYHSPLGRLMNHATVVIHHDSGRVTKIKNILSADEYAHIIKQITQHLSGKELNHNVQHFISEGEGRFVEFKETLRWDTRKEEINKEIEHAVAKTIVGFLNSEGGTLLIGINDNAKVIGLENDYKTLPKKNKDGFENHLSQLIKTTIGLQFTKYINIKFEKVENENVCIVSVGESRKPAYLHKSNDKEDFFVRVGNSTQPFSMSETEEYIKAHWR